MNCVIRPPLPQDLPALLQVERACFPPQEAAGEEALRYRIAAFAGSFFVAQQGDRIVGMVNGCVSNAMAIADDLFAPDSGHDPLGENQMIFDLAVHPDAQGQGIGGALLSRLVAESRIQGRRRVILTCKREKIPFYARFGFENRGISASVHGGAVWYDMILIL